MVEEVLDIYEDSMAEKSPSRYELDYQDNNLINKYQSQGGKIDFQERLRQMVPQEERQFRRTMEELSHHLEYRLDQSQVLSEQIFHQGNDDLRMDLINKCIS